MARWLMIVIMLLVLGPATVTDASDSTSTDRYIPVLPIKGAIGPATADFLLRALQDVQDNPHVPLIIVTLDTPGGLVSSLRDINSAVLASKVPLACLVYPQGARAASAGTYLLYACHIAAMAPATTLGAATPVSIGPATPNDKQSDDKQSSGQSAMEKKILNDSIAYIRSLAQLRKRNEEWAELAVRKAATLTASEALEKNVVNLISASPQDLLLALDGKTYELNEQLLTLSLVDAELRNQDPDWRNRFIATITNPNIAYLLMMIGFYGLLLEFYNPGLGISGVVGAISLLIALYAFQMLPVNYAGMLLLLLGIGLLVTEAMSPSFGIFGFGGLVAFVIGSIFLIDSDLNQFRVALPVIAALTATSAGFFIFILGYLLRMSQRKVVSGVESMIGATAMVQHDFDDFGNVWIDGEIWTAYSDKPVKKGQTVVVKSVEGLQLNVSEQQGEKQ